MEATEIRTLVQVEDRHWWYRERRNLVARAIKELTPGTAVDVGAAGGGNTRVLIRHGWRALAVEYGPSGAQCCADRGIPVIRADAQKLPLAPFSCDLVIAFDVLEHLVDDAAAVASVYSALRPGGTYVVAVPADPALWSAHDEAVDHQRRYTRDQLMHVLEDAGFYLDSVRSWMVLLRPAVKLRRRFSQGSDLDNPGRVLNTLLGGVVALERYLPVGRLPGVSLLVVARKPQE